MDSYNPIAQQMYMNLLNQTLQTINSISTASADARRLYNLLQSQDFAGNLLLDQWLNQFEADLNSGDQELILYDLMQAGSMLGSFCCKCFTGDTLVRTEEGFTRIDEVQVGDYVLAENVETGEKEYKKVLKVYVKEATTLVHLRTDGTKDEDQTIDATANHPFYVEGRGWVAAEDVEAGDRLHTEDGSVVVVIANETEKLRKPIKVYNLEVEDYHTYYVTADEVLVHNVYGKSGSEPPIIKGTSYDINKLYKTQPLKEPFTSEHGVQLTIEKIKCEGYESVEKIVVYVDNGIPLVVDGHHRLEAFRRLGYKRVPIKYIHKNQIKNYYRRLEDLRALMEK